MSVTSLAPRTITATLNYLLSTQEKPTRWIIDPPAGQPQWNGVADPHEVTIEDAGDHSERWSRVLLPGVADEGNELPRHRFAIVNVWRPIRG